MVSNTLSLTALAVTSGVGDVTGIVKDHMLLQPTKRILLGMLMQNYLLALMVRSQPMLIKQPLVLHLHGDQRLLIESMILFELAEVVILLMYRLVILNQN
jgi:hypothetical protein